MKQGRLRPAWRDEDSEAESRVTQPRSTACRMRHGLSRAALETPVTWGPPADEQVTYRTALQGDSTSRIIWFAFSDLCHYNL